MGAILATCFERNLAVQVEWSDSGYQNESLLGENIQVLPGQATNLNCLMTTLVTSLPFDPS